jgi:ribonuclease HII
MTYRYEKKKISEGYTHIIGCDEVGRGCLAGPVVAAAVIFDEPRLKDKGLTIKDINDSKLLLPKKREALSAIIKSISFAWSVGEVSVEVVDRINIHHASLLAMRKAVEGLHCHCERTSSAVSRSNPKQVEDCFVVPTELGAPRNNRYLLVVDGKFKVPYLDIDQEAIIDGDAKILSVAAASIIAKVYRDELMRKLHQRYPIYNFAQHKGYATKFHRKTIVRHGLCPIHRLTFCGHLF